MSAYSPSAPRQFTRSCPRRRAAVDRLLPVALVFLAIGCALVITTVKNF